MRPWGFETPHKAAQVQPSKHSPPFMVGEAHAHVQGAILKACAALLVRLSNSPASRLEGTMRRVASLVCVTTTAVALGWAGWSLAAPDDLFGRSYDECLLKNANKGGDAESRRMAAEVCERHFIRSATAAETGAVILGAKLYPDVDGDNIRFEISNNNQHVTLRHVEVVVLFRGSGDHLFKWSWDIEILPGAKTFIWGEFDDKKAPGEIIGTRLDDFKVLSPTGTRG